MLQGREGQGGRTRSSKMFWHTPGEELCLRYIKMAITLKFWQAQEKEGGGRGREMEEEEREGEGERVREREEVRG